MDTRTINSNLASGTQSTPIIGEPISIDASKVTLTEGPTPSSIDALILKTCKEKNIQIDSDAGKYIDLIPTIIEAGNESNVEQCITGLIKPIVPPEKKPSVIKLQISKSPLLILTLEHAETQNTTALGQYRIPAAGTHQGLMHVNLFHICTEKNSLLRSKELTENIAQKYTSAKIFIYPDLKNEFDSLLKKHEINSEISDIIVGHAILRMNGVDAENLPKVSGYMPAGNRGEFSLIASIFGHEVMRFVDGCQKSFEIKNTYTIRGPNLFQAQVFEFSIQDFMKHFDLFKKHLGELCIAIKTANTAQSSQTQSTPAIETDEDTLEINFHEDCENIRTPRFHMG